MRVECSTLQRIGNDFESLLHDLQLDLLDNS